MRSSVLEVFAAIPVPERFQFIFLHTYAKILAVRLKAFVHCCAGWPAENRGDVSIWRDRCWHGESGQV